jgi:hypothetical protein
MTALKPSLSQEDLEIQRHLGLRSVAAGMIALQNQGFTTSEGTFFSLTDGTYEMPDAKPYCFYHCQDRDHAIERGRLYLSFGPAHDPAQQDAAALLARTLAARAVVVAMENQGLKVLWDGDARVRVMVDLDASA